MMWFYQLSQTEWTPERFRYEIWENERWRWPVGKAQKWGKKEPMVGDTIAFFYAPSGGREAGFYGWAIIVEYLAEEDLIYFLPVAPTNFLKMCPWGDKTALKLADEIRGSWTRATMWLVKAEQSKMIRDGIRHWVSGTTK